ncbi:MAG: hypothetical protein ABSB40_05955 [Nitrososphaeria archaeon]|jgi:uncharacterized membrane protein
MNGTAAQTNKTKGAVETRNLALIIVFSALIAVSTILVIPLPAPIAEITWAPPIYFALSVLAGPWPAFFSTALGSFIGEFYNVSYRGFPFIYAPGIVWARAPEALIIGWARKKKGATLAMVMGLATVYETLAFLIPDWLFYTYGLFGYSHPMSLTAGFYFALPDVLTMVDIIYIPISFVIIRFAKPVFQSMGFAK